MKFTKQLELNMYPPWHSHYINYKKFKKIIKSDFLHRQRSIESLWDEFSAELRHEIETVSAFFTARLAETRNEIMEISFLNKPDVVLRESIIHNFLLLGELSNFIRLNSEGLRKSIKKFDKKYSTAYQQSSLIFPEFPAAEAEIQLLSEKLVDGYARFFTEGDRIAASEDLHKELTGMLIFEKGTIWQDLLKLEQNRSRLGVTRVDTVLFERPRKVKIFTLVFVHVIFLSLLIFFSSSDHASRRCFGLLIFVSGLWTANLLPLFATSMMIPLLVVFLDLFPDLEDRKSTASTVLSHFFGSGQAMVLGSFAVAAGLSKVRLDKKFTHFFVSSTSNPSKTLFSIMLMAWILSGLIGNVASSVISITAIQPILDGTGTRSAIDEPSAKKLLLGIAIACNLGGAISPIASPQNVIAFAAINANHSLSFLEWLYIGGISSFIILIVSYTFLVSERNIRTNSESPLEKSLLLQSTMSPKSIYPDSVFSWKSVYVILITMVTFILWMTTDFVSKHFGSVGLVSFIPLVGFFGIPSILNKSDFLSLPWDLCILLAGGSILGHAIESSGLLSNASSYIQSWLTNIFMLCLFISVISTFVSHTAAANVLMPFIIQLTAKQNIKYSLAASLCLSAGMALPISSFPNMNSISVAKQNTNETWLKPTDFINPGIFVNITATVVFSLLVPVL
jgi:phosphate transporter